jgi:phosphomannomutase
LGGGVGTGAGGDRRSQACRIVGKSQSVLIMINPMIFTRTHRFEETLTGFKWMGERAAQLRAEGRTVLLAYEEAIGFCGERAVASLLAVGVLTEIYLCASCSCHEILRGATARVSR